jgi:hypothetical protein
MTRFFSPARARVTAEYCRRVGLAKLLLAAAVAASLTMEVSSPGAQVRRSTSKAGATTDQADAQAAVLDSLKANIATVTAASRTVYEQSALVLERLVNSEFPDQSLRAAAVAALRKVARLCHQLDVANRVLADALEAVATNQRAPSGELGPLIERFDVARAGYDRSADQLLDHIRALHIYEVTRASSEDKIARRQVDQSQKNSELYMLEGKVIEREAIELQALIDATEPYATAHNALGEAISELAPVLAGTATRQASESSILLSVYGFFDETEQEEEGYGLYTYVILAPGIDANNRNVSFLRELLRPLTRASISLQRSAPS